MRLVDLKWISRGCSQIGHKIVALTYMLLDLNKYVLILPWCKSNYLLKMFLHSVMWLMKNSVGLVQTKLFVWV